MAANIIFVDEGTIDEVVGGEDSDFDENTDNSESSEEEDGRSEEDSDDEEESEEETEEDNWVLGDRIPRRLDFTADRGFNVKLPYIHHSLTTFISSSLKTYSMRLYLKHINMQRKQLHLYSEEIVYLGTRGLEIGLRVV